MNTQPDPRETVDDIVDHDDVDLSDEFVDDPYDSLAEGVPFAHHVVSPALLAGLSDAPIALCRTFHRALFDLLDGVGGFDGLIATRAALIGPGDSTKWAGAFSWLRASPAPDAQLMYEEHIAAGYEPAEASEHVTHTVTHHSLGLAIELGTNPSFTHASLPSLSHALLVRMSSEIDQGDVHHIDTLTDVAVELLAITSFECRLEGGARVVDTGALLELAHDMATSV